MKRIVWSLLFLVAAALITLRSLALAQDAEQPGQLHGYYTVVPLHGATGCGGRKRFRPPVEAP